MKQVITKSILITTALLILICKNSIGQLGIGTATPSGLLAVTSSSPAAPPTTTGFLVPRVSAFPATNPGASQNGMMIFLTATVSGNAPGFYYWDNPSTAWKKIVVGSSASSTTGYGAPVVSAAGGTNLVYGTGGWINNTLTNVPLTSTSPPTRIYNPPTPPTTIAPPRSYYFSPLTT